MTVHPLAEISAYADGELSAADFERVERHIAGCSECARELSIIQMMGEEMNRSAGAAAAGRDLWPSVHRRVTQPIGWILAIAGAAVWMVLALVEWLRARSLTWEWLSATAIGIGIAMIVVAIGHQQYREWKSSPYKDIER